MNERSGSAEAAVQAAFERARNAWDDDKAHEAVLAAARATGAFIEAARLYRAEKERSNERAEACERRLKQIALLAMASLDEQQTPRKTGLPAWAKWGIVSLIALGTAWYLWKALAIL